MCGKIRYRKFISTLVACFALTGGRSTLAQGFDPILHVAPLAPERISPQDLRSVTDIKPEPGFVDYLVYSQFNMTDGPPPIFHLRIPDIFFRRNRGKINHAWDVFINAKYISSTGTIIPYPKDEPFCNAKNCQLDINILIGNRSSKDNFYNYREESAKKYLQIL